MNYPHSIAEVIDDAMIFRPEILEVAEKFKGTHPWRGTINERKAKFAALHADLCQIFGKRTTLGFGRIDGSPSDNSSYCRCADTITLRGRLSVVTYLHEFAHALGLDERGACEWSLNLFRQIFPKIFSRGMKDGHMLRVPR